MAASTVPSKACTRRCADIFAARAPGTRLHLVVQGKRWTAKIVWSDQGEAGLAFSRPLTEGELNAIQNQGGVSTGLGAAPTRNHHGFREMR